MGDDNIHFHNMSSPRLWHPPLQQSRSLPITPQVTPIDTDIINLKNINSAIISSNSTLGLNLDFDHSKCNNYSFNDVQLSPNTLPPRVLSSSYACDIPTSSIENKFLCSYQNGKNIKPHKTFSNDIDMEIVTNNDVDDAHLPNVKLLSSRDSFSNPNNTITSNTVQQQSCVNPHDRFLSKSLPSSKLKNSPAIGSTNNSLCTTCLDHCVITKNITKNISRQQICVDLCNSEAFNSHNISPSCQPHGVDQHTIPDTHFENLKRNASSVLQISAIDYSSLPLPETCHLTPTDSNAMPLNRPNSEPCLQCNQNCIGKCSSYNQTSNEESLGDKSISVDSLSNQESAHPAMEGITEGSLLNFPQMKSDSSNNLIL